MENWQILRWILVPCLLILGLSSCLFPSPRPPQLDPTEEAIIPDSLCNATYELVAEIATKNAQAFSTDRLMNVYIVSNNDELRKYSPKGDDLGYLYSDNNYGEITHVDATDPFNILIYHADFQTVVILNQRLSPSAIFDLNKIGILSAPTVCMSSDQNIWVYDDIETRLKKIDRTGKILFEGENLSNLQGKFFPNFMLESGNAVYMNTAGEELRHFDLFGKFVGTEPIRPPYRFQVVDGLIAYPATQYHIRRYSPKYDLTETLTFPYGKRHFKGMDIRQNQLFVLDSDRLTIYRFEMKNPK